MGAPDHNDHSQRSSSPRTIKTFTTFVANVPQGWSKLVSSNSCCWGQRVCRARHRQCNFAPGVTRGRQRVCRARHRQCNFAPGVTRGRNQLHSPTWRVSRYKLHRSGYAWLRPSSISPRRRIVTLMLNDVLHGDARPTNITQATSAATRAQAFAVKKQVAAKVAQEGE